MPIPFLDLRRQYREIEPAALEALARVAGAGSYILGPEVEAFEAEWAGFCEARACAGVANGTDALALALLASGAVRPGRGDEVITAPLSAGYTALAVLNAGAVPVFADVDPRTLTLDPASVERSVTPRTRAVVPVHLYGRAADMNGINDVARRLGLFVVEDAAQAHGARYEGRRVGSLAGAAAFSFYPTKNLGAYGDGGAVTSEDASLVARVKELRQGGHPGALLQSEIAGFNSRLDEMQAALLRVKLRLLDDWNRRRRQHAEAYRELLSDSRHGLALPAPAPHGSHVQHLYVVQHPERERLRTHLSASGVETLIHYPYLLHQQPLFRRPEQRPLPAAEAAVSRILSLPLHPHLDAEELRAVAAAVLDFDPND